ncbi:DUF2878 domain-containing protein [Dyella sp. ASV21]|jgi:hypothetical protein|uniref:DUF2878 domain-containing protein n=1 Tax=Dyella sp. ASV21 TaxID=2795114 RepID=UPI0018EB5FAF|nr:DUF2878 domain-containing protein [Dyella sp. ASV21]
MNVWGNLVGYQLTWLLLVWGAARDHLWLGLGAGLAFVIWQVGTSHERGLELRLLLAALLCGVLVDGVAAGTGWLSYAAPVPAAPPHGAPWWILMLWLCFATTVNRSLKFLHHRPWLAALLGGVGAPMAYLAAARGWQAVQFHAPEALGLGWIALCWALALPLLGQLSDRWHQRMEARHA